MKLIWDTQSQEPLYAMNEPALHRIVQRRNQETNRCLARCFALEITVGLVCAAMMVLYTVIVASGHQHWVVKPWDNRVTASEWDYLGFAAAAAIWLYYAGYMYLARKRQQQRVERFDSSLRGDLERALAQTDFQITTARSIVWWGLAPVWIATLIWLVVLCDLKGAPAWLYLVMITVALAALAAVIASKQRSITNKYQPRQRELESLKSKLVER